MYDGNPGEIDFGSSQREVRVSEGSSYRESTVFNVTPFKWVNKGKKVYELFVEMQEKVCIVWRVSMKGGLGCLLE